MRLTKFKVKRPGRSLQKPSCKSKPPRTSKKLAGIEVPKQKMKQWAKKRILVKK